MQYYDTLLDYCPLAAALYRAPHTFNMLGGWTPGQGQGHGLADGRLRDGQGLLVRVLKVKVALEETVRHVPGERRRVRRRVPLRVHQEEAFLLAEKVFLHQRVFDPRSKQLVYLNDPPENVILSEEIENFIGQYGLICNLN